MSANGSTLHVLVAGAGPDPNGTALANAFRAVPINATLPAEPVAGIAELVNRAVKALDMDTLSTDTVLQAEMMAFAALTTLSWLFCVLVACYRSKAIHCNCNLWSYYCGEFWCRKICCRKPLSEQDEIARGPDQAIEEHQDEDADVDSIDEPVRRTPPVTDGEEEEEEDLEEGLPSPSRAGCSSLAAAMASSDALASEAPAEAPAAAPAAAAPRGKGKRVATKTVAFKKE